MPNFKEKNTLKPGFVQMGVFGDMGGIMLYSGYKLSGYRATLIIYHDPVKE
jgi:hypothetical protein